MKLYSDLQKHNRFLKNEITGSVALGASGDELIVLNLTPDGNLILDVEDTSNRRVAVGGTVVAGDTVLVYDEVMAQRFNMKRLLFTANGLGELVVKVDDVIWFTCRNSYFTPTFQAQIGKVVEAGVNLKIYFRNTSFTGQTNVYECYLMGS